MEYNINEEDGENEIEVRYTHTHKGTKYFIYLVFDETNREGFYYGTDDSLAMDINSRYGGSGLGTCIEYKSDDFCFNTLDYVIKFIENQY